MTPENSENKNSKLSLSATILLGCFILGGFYYATETNKQKSIERQQQVELRAQQAEQQATKDKEILVAAQKADCKIEAEQNAISLYKNSPSCSGAYGITPAKNCGDGETYLVSQYNNAYGICLQGKGLE